jgi:hypothetical protein
MEELPGPPFIQMANGAFSGSLRASKNLRVQLLANVHTGGWVQSHTRRMY